MRRLAWKTVLLGAMALLLAAPPALAVDLTDTTWDLQGRSRMWARSLGRDFGASSGQIAFTNPAFTLSISTTSMSGVWEDAAGRRFRGHFDDAALRLALETFINSMPDVAGAEVDGVRVNRIWGHVNKNLDRIKLKVRVKVWFRSDSPEVERRGAWIKLGLRGTLQDGSQPPVVNP